MNESQSSPNPLDKPAQKIPSEKPAAPSDIPTTGASAEMGANTDGSVPDGSPAAPANKSAESPEQASPPAQSPSTQATPTRTPLTQPASIPSEQQSPPTSPALVQPVSVPSKSSTPAIPPADDTELDAEITAALGDVSLMDVYSAEGSSDQANLTKPPSSDEADTNKPAPGPGLIRGRVAAINGEDIFVDLGGKSQGLLPAEELSEGDRPQVGEEIDVAIIRYDSRDGLLMLSQRSADQQKMMRDLCEGSIVEARVTGTNKGGLEMDIKGIKAFMPASQIDIGRTDDLDSLVGQCYECEVIQVDRGDKNVVLSRRNLLQKQRQEQRELLWTELEKGQRRHGVVRSLTNYGAFIDIGGLDGLLHVREMSWARVKHPGEILKVDQEIDVLVIDIDHEKRRVALSLRQAGGDPWTAAQQKYVVGSSHQAQICNLMDFGAFAELEPGVEGLIPVSQMTWVGRVRHPSDVVQPGQMVEVEIVAFDINRRRVTLSMKRLQENPWENVGDKYLENKVYTGKVSRITDFGAFITLESGVDGLIHISELSDNRVGKVSDVVSADQEISVRVVNVDAKNQRIALSLKGFGADQQEGADSPAAPTQMSAESADGRKKKKDRPRRGGLTWDF